MKTLILSFFLFFLILTDSNAACVPTGSTQHCSYTLSWTYDSLATGFIVQQMVDQNNVWYDIYDPIPLTQRTLVDDIFNDAGNRNICWRVFAYNSVGRSDPSNTACVTTPQIQPASSVNISVREGLIVNVSRRATDTTSIISILINKDEVLGPAGIEISYPQGMILNISRRATNTTSVVSILVNKSQVVTVNGQVR